MIPTSDLRKGNIIKTEYGILPVHAIVFDDVQVIGSDGRILWAKEVEGVRINDGLLIQLGFSKDPDGCLTIDKFFYWVPRGYWGDVGVLQIAVGYSPLINCPCVFAHELQNLYYWHKRKELHPTTLNEDVKATIQKLIEHTPTPMIRKYPHIKYPDE